MTIQELGSIGELVGAVATIATLVYLATQIRQNSKIITASTAASTRERQIEVSRIIGTNVEAARVWRVGLSDRAALTADEMQQLDGLVHLSFTSLLETYRNGQDIADDARRIGGRSTPRVSPRTSASW